MTEKESVSSGSGSRGPFAPAALGSNFGRLRKDCRNSDGAAAAASERRHPDRK